jgi:hypothetical protein
MWRDYFGPDSRIGGVDVNPRLQDLGDSGIEIHIGDQSDRQFLRELAPNVGPIDILIAEWRPYHAATDHDGRGSVWRSEGGRCLLLEDTHTSYSREYGGGLRTPCSFMEFAKRLVDELNAWFSHDPHSF